MVAAAPRRLGAARARRARQRGRCGPGSAFAAGFGEIGEELVGHALGDAVDQARAELGDLAADLRLDVIAQQGPPPSASASDTLAPPLAKPAMPPSPSPVIV